VIYINGDWAIEISSYMTRMRQLQKKTRWTANQRHAAGGVQKSGCLPRSGTARDIAVRKKPNPRWLGQGTWWPKDQM